MSRRTPSADLSGENRPCRNGSHRACYRKTACLFQWLLASWADPGRAAQADRRKRWPNTAAMRARSSSLWTISGFHRLTESSASPCSADLKEGKVTLRLIFALQANRLKAPSVVKGMAIAMAKAGGWSPKFGRARLSEACAPNRSRTRCGKRVRSLAPHQSRARLRGARKSSLEELPDTNTGAPSSVPDFILEREN